MLVCVEDASEAVVSVDVKPGGGGQLRRASRFRCQRSTVSGRTSSRNRPRTSFGNAVQQGAQERPVGGGEPRPVRAQLPLQDHDLVP